MFVDHEESLLIQEPLYFDDLTYAIKSREILFNIIRKKYSNINVIIATTNNKKIEMFKQCLRHFTNLSGVLFNVYTISDLDPTYKIKYPKPRSIFSDNAKLKSSHIYSDIKEGKLTVPKSIRDSNYFIITNDSGLLIPGLDWPGTRTEVAYEDVSTPELGKGLTSAEAILYRFKKREYERDFSSWIFSRPLYVSSTCIRRNFSFSIHHRLPRVRTASHQIEIIDPRIENPNIHIETMGDITRLVNIHCNSEPITSYDPRPISQLSTETLMLSGDPMFDSFMYSMFDTLIVIARIQTSEETPKEAEELTRWLDNTYASPKFLRRI